MNILTLLAVNMGTVSEKFWCVATSGAEKAILNDDGVEKYTTRAECIKDGHIWEAAPMEESAKGNINNIVINVINAILGVVGLIAVVMIILGGISYMTSAGDASKVKKGKDTILYGIIGLVIVGLAFAIVNFVIANLINQA